MKHTYLVILFFIVAGFISCESEKDQESNRSKAQNFEAIVVDSLMVDWLSELKLMDYNEATGEFLVEDQTDRQLMIVDDQGEIVLRFNPHIESPNYVGDFDHGWIFFGEEQLMCYSNYYFHLFDKEGNRIKRFEYPVEVSSIWKLDYDPQLMFNYQLNDEQKFVAMITGPKGPRYNTQAFQDSVQMVYSIDVDKEEGFPIMDKPNDLVYRTLGAFVDRGWPYMRNYEGSKFAQIYSVDDYIYFWDAESNQLLNKVEIPEEFKPNFETIPFGSTEEPDRLRINANIYNTKDYVILQSLDRIPESVMKQIMRESRWWEGEALKEAGKKYVASNHLVFNEEGFLGKLTYNIGKYQYYKISTKSDFMWFQRTYDDERDYRTFLKVKIVPAE